MSCAGFRAELSEVLEGEDLVRGRVQLGELLGFKLGPREAVSEASLMPGGADPGEASP